jgi:NAD-dependent deacetylase
MRTSESYEDTIRRARARLASARAVAVLTGAGISAESGVPTFRGSGGLWRQFRPEDLATPDAFRRDPALVWEWYRWRRDRIAEAQPNAGHEWLVDVERRAPSFTLITQNVDGLHRRAGSRRVIELHGNIFLTVCAGRCGAAIDETPWSLAHGGAPASALPVPQCDCGSPMRPGVVWFGEHLNERVVLEAVDASERADVMLVIGTSALVHPAAALPDLTLRAGGCVIEINPEETPLSDRASLCLRGPAAEACPRLGAPW